MANSSPRTRRGSARARGARGLTYAARRRRRIRNAIILAFELVALVFLALVLRAVVMPMARVGKVELNNARIVQEMNEGVVENETLKGFTTIALFGVDSREGALSDATLSDVIILCAINKETGDIRLCSVYRDTFLNVGDYYTKCNAAYSWGGPEQAINMLNKNLDLDITDFATIGFKGIVDIIDELGGIDVDVDEEAVIHLNNYQWKMAQEMNGFATLEEAVGYYEPLEHGGYQTLNGLQATALCRVRYVSGGDFTRASYQRMVLQAIFAKAKANPTKVPVAAERLFDEVYTSYDLTQILAMAVEVLKGDIAGNGGFPQMDMVTTGIIGSEGDCVVPQTLESNVSWLHAFLFEDTAYVPSETVLEYSREIANRTAPYLN